MSFALRIKNSFFKVQVNFSSIVRRVDKIDIRTIWTTDTQPCLRCGSAYSSCRFVIFNETKRTITADFRKILRRCISSNHTFKQQVYNARREGKVARYAGTLRDIAVSSSTSIWYPFIADNTYLETISYINIVVVEFRHYCLLHGLK